MKLHFIKQVFVVLLAAAVPTVMSALNFWVDGMYFKVINDNEVEVAYRYNTEYSGNIVVPETVDYSGVTYRVTAIGEDAFRGQDIITLNTGNSVKSIAKGAFDMCTSLASVYIGSSVEQIAESPFGRSGVTSVEVHPDNPFFDSREHCNAIIETATNTLTAACIETVIPNTVTAIGIGAFGRMDSLKSIVIPASVVTIGDRAFWWCTQLESVSILGPVETIGESAFDYNYKLTDINIPSTVKSIGQCAFHVCTSLTSIHIPDGVTVITERMLDCCYNLTDLTIGDHVTAIEDFALQECRVLANITLPPTLKSIGWDSFAGDKKLTSILLPDSLEFIGESAFYNCDLRSIVIPKSVTSIGTDVLASNRYLTKIVVEEGNPVYDSRDNCNAIIETATNRLIEGCKSTVVPSTVTTIGHHGFSGCFGLTSISLPESVTTLEHHAFYDCVYLNTVVLPQSVTTVGQGAFAGCRRMKSMTCKAKIPPTTGDYPFSTEGLRGTLYVPRSAIERYRADEKWGEHATILPMPDGGIGDADGDGLIGVSDISYMVGELMNGNVDVNDMPSGDVNGDGMINVGDIAALINYLLNT